MPDQPTTPPDLRTEAIPASLTALGGPAPQPLPPPRETFRQGFARGMTGEPYVVDARGNVVSARATSGSGRGTFGAILAGAVMGALAGASAPGQEGGFDAGQRYFERRDLMRRGQAQQDLQNRLTVKAAENQDLEHKARLHVENLTAIRMAHENAEAEVNDPLRHQQLVNAAAASSLALDAEVKNLGLINERVYHNYQDVPQADIDRFNRHEVKLLALGDGTVKVWDRTFDARTTPNAQDFEVRDLTGLDPRTGRPTWKVVGHVKAGGGTVAQQEAELDKERQQLYDAAGKNASIAKERAQTGEILARTELTRAQLAQAKALGVNVPEDFQLPDNIKALSPGDLQKALAGQNVRLPDFNTLYAIGHYELDPKTYWSAQRKGATGLSRPQALNLIRTFIMPDYDDSRYAALKGMEKEFASTRTGTAGGNLIAFNTAAGHLGQLYDAAAALRNGDTVALNRVANYASQQTGSPVKPNFEAIKGVLVGELGRLMKGAAPDIPEMNELRVALNAAQSPEQFAGVTRQYAHAMLTKGIENIQHYYDWKGKLPPSFSPQARAVLERLGVDVNAALRGIAGGTTPGAQGPRPGGVEVRDPSTGTLLGYSYDGGKTMEPVR